MKTFNHTKFASNDIHMLQRQYKGNGIYYISGLFQGIEVGDEIVSHTQFNGNKFMPLKVIEIISVSDSKADGLGFEQKNNALIELMFIDEYYPDNPNLGYKQYENFGN